MRSTIIVLVLGLVALIGVVGAGATYALGSSDRDEIAEGIRIQGVSVGGLTAEEAEEKLQRDLVAPLARPVRVRAAGKTFTLSTKAARVHMDFAASVAEALERSRRGGVIERAIKSLKGEDRVDVNLPVEVEYSRSAIDDVVERVEETTYRAPKDASIDIGPSGISTVAGREGRAAVVDGLAKRIRTRLLSYDGSRSVRVRTKAVEPKVTTKNLAERYPAILIVKRKSFKMELYKGLKLAKTYGIAVGKVGMDTPAGLYSIANKAENPAWHVPNSDWAGDLAGKVIPGGVPENPIKARWLGIADGVGIHGTGDEGSIGSAASHGCVRMRVREVKELYPQVPVGAPIYIA